jgi:hypothetical protein
MKRRKTIPVPHEPIPPRVYAIMQRRAREVVRHVGQCVHPVTLDEIAICGYYAGLADMAQALRRHPQYAIAPQDEDWQMP